MKPLTFLSLLCFIVFFVSLTLGSGRVSSSKDFDIRVEKPALEDEDENRDTETTAHLHLQSQQQHHNLAKDFWQIEDADVIDDEDEDDDNNNNNENNNNVIQPQNDLELEEMGGSDVSVLLGQLQQLVKSSNRATEANLKSAKNALKKASKDKAVARKTFRNLIAQMRKLKKDSLLQKRTVKHHTTDCADVKDIAQKKLDLITSLRGKLDELNQLRGKYGESEEISNQQSKVMQLVLDLAVSSNIHHRSPKGSSVDVQMREINNILEMIRKFTVKRVQDCEQKQKNSKKTLTTTHVSYKSLFGPAKKARQQFIRALINWNAARERVSVLRSTLLANRITQNKQLMILNAINKIAPITPAQRAQQLATKLDEVLADMECSKQLAVCSHKQGLSNKQLPQTMQKSQLTCRQLLQHCNNQK